MNSELLSLSKLEVWFINNFKTNVSVSFITKIFQPFPSKICIYYFILRNSFQRPPTEKSDGLRNVTGRAWSLWSLWRWLREKGKRVRDVNRKGNIEIKPFKLYLSKLFFSRRQKEEKIKSTEAISDGMGHLTYPIRPLLSDPI